LPKGKDEKDEDEREHKKYAIIIAITGEKKKMRTQKGRGQDRKLGRKKQQNVIRR
jgi:hypothetical protein